MLEWIANYAARGDVVCRQIASRRAALKIVLKTKNEKFLLERWLAYHLGVVGDGNVIVFDNMSNDPAIAPIYKRYRERIVLTRFAGYPDSIHYPGKYPDLFAALKTSCDFFVFLDTDEFLTWIDADGSYLCDDGIVHRLAERASGRIIPGTWIANVPGFDDRFYLDSGDDDSDADWGWGLRWGKPVYGAGANLPTNCLHNCYIPLEQYGKLECFNVFIRHMTALSAEQRIAANLNKLRAMRFIGPKDTMEVVLGMDLDKIESELARGYCSEIQTIEATIQTLSGVTGPLENSVQFGRDGRLVFFNEPQRRRLQTYLGDPPRYAAMLTPP